VAVYVVGFPWVAGLVVRINVMVSEDMGKYLVKPRQADHSPFINNQ